MTSTPGGAQPGAAETLEGLAAIAIHDDGNVAARGRRQALTWRQGHGLRCTLNAPRPTFPSDRQDVLFFGRDQGVDLCNVLVGGLLMSASARFCSSSEASLS